MQYQSHQQILVETLKTGLQNHEVGDLEIAEKCYAQVLESDPVNLVALKFLGEIHAGNNRLDDAVACMKTVAAKEKNNLTAQLDYAKALLKTRAYGTAQQVLRQAIKRHPRSDVAYFLWGLSLSANQDHEAAIVQYTKALRLNSRHALTLDFRGQAYAHTSQHKLALQDFNKAIALDPDSPSLYYQRGMVRSRQGDPAGAARDLTHAIELNPKHLQANICLGELLVDLKLYSSAVASFARAMAADPKFAYVMSSIVQCNHMSCYWENYAADNAYLRQLILTQQTVEKPFDFLNISSSAQDQLTCTNFHATARYGSTCAKPPFAPSSRNKIRVAYVSADYYSHATAYLCRRLFAGHDRDAFEVIGISLNTAKNDAMTEQLRPDFDAYHEVIHLSDQQVAQKIRELEIDILVDLKGYTHGSRTAIFAAHPAPVQVNYLGFPGTMGGHLMDYIVADAVLIPTGFDAYYTEQVVRLPGSYQITNNQRLVPPDALRKSDHGLPEAGFVFCSFNNNYKLTPAVFDIWMRLLQQVPDSVLWLMANNTEAVDNLKREAQLRGVNAERLVFAPTMSQAEHLARHQHADLFLDTLPINAHTTASDALWAGLPLVTCPGEAFAARVAASLLCAAGLPELVTSNHTDYESLALRLAQEPALLASYKARLQVNRLSCDLFNTEKTIRNLEAAYHAMHARRQAGLAPQAIDLTCETG